MYLLAESMRNKMTFFVEKKRILFLIVEYEFSYNTVIFW